MRLRALFGVAFGAFLIIAGCGTHRPPPQADGTTAAAPPVNDGTTFATDAGAPQLPGCGVKIDGTQCDCTDVPLFIDPPAIYFVLDRSLSMAVDDKWTRTRVVVAEILRSIGPRAKFGAMMFPGGADECSAGTEAMSIRNGDVPSPTGTDGPTTTTLLAATRVSPAGGTPTAASLQAVLPILRREASPSFVILATDGAPNCDAAANCGFDQCQLNLDGAPGCPAEGPTNCCADPYGIPENCSDGPATVSAVAALESAGFPVYVVGLPGTARYGALLDQMADSGGTAQPSSPKYYAVDSASQDAMLAALKKVAAKITGTCKFQLRTEPSEPAFVNVYLDSSVLPYEPVNGWRIDGKQVTLLGTACDRVQNGDVLNVRIIQGCPRVEPR